MLKSKKNIIKNLAIKILYNMLIIKTTSEEKHT